MGAAGRRSSTLARVGAAEDLPRALADAGGVAAPGSAGVRLRRLLLAELERGAWELRRTRSGYRGAVAVGLAASHGRLRAVLPVSAGLRADPEAVGERGWLLVAGAVGALVEAAGLGPPARPSRSGAATSPPLELWAGGLAGWLVLEMPGGDAELAALCFDDQVADVDRLRARAHALPAHAVVLDHAARPPIGAGHPLRAAELVARLGGRPAAPGAEDALEEAIVALTVDADGGEGRSGPGRPHRDPRPDRRAARRIVQRLSGMGKWGGYHTEFRHLARGFPPSEVALALAVGERLLDAGLLVEKTSVGQRHVFLNPRRAADVYALIDEGRVPAGLVLPRG